MARARRAKLCNTTLFIPVGRRDQEFRWSGQIFACYAYNTDQSTVKASASTSLKRLPRMVTTEKGGAIRVSVASLNSVHRLEVAFINI